MSEEANTRPARGVSFGGGTENEYVRAFEKKREEAVLSGGSDESIREEIRGIRPLGESYFGADEWEDASDGEPYVSDVRMDEGRPQQVGSDARGESTGFRLPDDVASYAYFGGAQRSAESEGFRLGDGYAPVREPYYAYGGARPPYGDGAYPDAQDEDAQYGDGAPEAYPEDDEDEYEYVDLPASRFKRVFSESGFLAGMEIALGAACAAFLVLYVITVMIRDMVFANVQAVYQSYQAGYSMTFESDLLNVLRLVLYLLPVLAIVFAVALILAQRGGKHFGKKIPVVIMVLLVVAAAFAAFDVTFAHLLF